MAKKKSTTKAKRKVITPASLNSKLRRQGLKLPHGYSIAKRKRK